MSDLCGFCGHFRWHHLDIIAQPPLELANPPCHEDGCACNGFWTGVAS